MLSTHSCVRDSVTLKCAGIAEVMASVLRSSTVRTSCSIQVVRSEGGAGGADSLVRGALQTIGVSASLTPPDHLVGEEAKRTRSNALRSGGKEEEAGLADCALRG